MKHRRCATSIGARLTAKMEVILKDTANTKAFMIKAYFDDLEGRIAFLKQLHQDGHRDEALMLCCCYIEAIGSRKHYQSDRKAKNYAKILEEESGNPLFSLVHPQQILCVLKGTKSFKNDMKRIEPLIENFGKALQTQTIVFDTLSPMLSEDQKKWLLDNLFKGTIAAISYDMVRSELVHDISAGNVTFSETTVNSAPVPDLNFDLLYPALLNIFVQVKNKSIETNSWYWEQ